MLILMIAGCFALLLCIPSLIEVFPALTGCIFRSHESENLASSVSLSRSRDRVCFALLIPFLLIVGYCDLYAPATFIDPPPLKIAVLLGVFAAYCLLRLILRVIVRHTKRCVYMDERRWKCVTRVPFTFFAVAELLLCATAGTAAFFSCPPAVLRSILLWELAAVYALCMIRKTQIFAQYRGFLSSFLYLCTLEILPTFLLVFTAMRF